MLPSVICGKLSTQRVGSAAGVELSMLWTWCEAAPTLLRRPCSALPWSLRDFLSPNCRFLCTATGEAAVETWGTGRCAW